MSAHAKKASAAIAILGVVLVCVLATHSAAPPMRAQEAKKEKRSNLRDTTIRDRVHKKIDFPGLSESITLRQALDQLGKAHGVWIDIDERGFRVEGLNNTADENDGPVVATAEKPIRPIKSTLGVVLDRILARVPVPSGSRYVIRNDRIEITTERFLEAEFAPEVVAKRMEDAENGEAPSVGWPPLALVWEDLDNVTVADALRTIASVMDVSILIDPRVESKTATKIGTTLRNVPLDTAVKFLADMAGLAVAKQGATYYVTSPENALVPAKKKKK